SVDSGICSAHPRSEGRPRALQFRSEEKSGSSAILNRPEASESCSPDPDPTSSTVASELKLKDWGRVKDCHLRASIHESVAHPGKNLKTIHYRRILSCLPLVTDLEGFVRGDDLDVIRTISGIPAGQH